MTPEKPETTLGDFKAVFRAIHQLGLNMLVVGGQAANFWGRFFLPAEPGISEYLPLTSKDLDLLGDAQALSALAASLKVPFTRTEPGSPSPVVGFFSIQTSTGIEATVEVLFSLHGVSDDEIKDGAVVVQDSDLQLELRLPSPFACLKAKTHNTANLDPSRRQDGKHLKILLLCNRAFLRQIVLSAERHELPERDAVRAVEKLFVFSQSAVAGKVTETWDINWLQAFPVSELHATPLPRLQRFYQHRLRQTFPLCPPPKS